MNLHTNSDLTNMGGAIMRVRWSAATFLFFFLFSIQVLGLGEARAWCCPCTCMPTCTCAGKIDPVQGRCWGCFSIDQGRVIASTNRTVGEPTLGATSPILTKTDMNGEVVAVRMRQSCLRDRVLFSLLGDNRILNFKLLQLNEHEKDQSIAFNFNDH